MNDASVKKPTLCIMSLKRLNSIKTILENKYGPDHINDVMQEICQAINFNPDYAKGRYTPDLGRKHGEWQKNRAAELGISQFQYRRGDYKST